MPVEFMDDLLESLSLIEAAIVHLSMNYSQKGDIFTGTILQQIGGQLDKLIRKWDYEE